MAWEAGATENIGIPTGAGAGERFTEALALDPANFEAQDWLTRAAEEASKVRLYRTEVEAIQELFADGDYRSSLYKLYRVEAPSDGEQNQIDDWIVACWYDWGVQLLQQGRPRDAGEKFEEVLGLTPDDEEAVRHVQLVERYSTRSVDAAYRTYTGRLVLRQLN